MESAGRCKDCQFFSKRGHEQFAPEWERLRFQGTCVAVLQGVGDQGPEQLAEIEADDVATLRVNELFGCAMFEAR